MKRPSDKELDTIKQLIGARTIHLQLGVDPDKQNANTTKFICTIHARMSELFGKAALRAADNSSDFVAYHSFYDTALMRIWWEKFGDTVDARGSTGTGEVGGRLESTDSPDADEAT